MALADSTLRCNERVLGPRFLRVNPLEREGRAQVTPSKLHFQADVKKCCLACLAKNCELGELFAGQIRGSINSPFFRRHEVRETCSLRAENFVARLIHFQPILLSRRSDVQLRQAVHSNNSITQHWNSSHPVPWQGSRLYRVWSTPSDEAWDPAALNQTHLFWDDKE